MKKALFAIFLGLTSPAWAAPADHFVKQGEEALAARDVAGALKAFDAALDADPKNAKAAYDRGRINLVLHKNVNAIADFTSAILADPTMGVAYSARAEAKIVMKDENGGFEDLDAGVKASPNNAEVYILRATYRMRRGDASGAKADLQSARNVADEKMAILLDAMIAKIQ
ncbi:MAG: tetratricopeptide repeat protein [Aestuariivirga sp.]